MDDNNELVKILLEERKAREEQANKFTDLLVKSEGRIDRTNEMIAKCVDTVNKLTIEYSNQIDRLQICRDSLIKQNQELLEIVRSAEKRYDILLEKVFSMVSKNNSENNINVR